MSFLDEGTFVGKGAVKDALKDPEFKALKGDEKANALKTLKMGGSVTTEIEEANAFLAAADAARDKGDKEFEFPKGSGKMHKVTLKRNLDIEEGKLANALGGVALLAGLLLMNKINSNDPVVQRLQAEYEQAEPAKKDSIQKLMTKRLIFLDTGKFDDSTPMNEDEYNPPEYRIFEPEAGRKGRFRSAVGYKPLKSPTDTVGDLKKFGKKATKIAGKRFDKGFAKFVGAEYKTPFSDLVADLKRTVDKSDNTELQKFAKNLTSIEDMSQAEFDAFIKELGKEGYDRKEIQKIKDRYKKSQQEKNKPKPKNVKETKQKEFDYKAPKDKDNDDIRIDPDTEFKVDLKHLIQKHMKEGKSKEDTIKLTKKLMAKLHNKGEVKIDGTTLIFKEADVPQDTQLALPEPPKQTANFLGPDNMDYEGGMAKLQMLKMKNYAKALCDMIDDETQLESWVQAKLTKASDYMSSVYHYLDYQRTKNVNETVINGKKVDPKSLEGEDNMFTYAEFMDGTELTDAELDLLSDDDDTLYDYFGPGGKGHIPRSDFM